MTRMSLGEKIGVFFDVISKNQLSILVLILLVGLAYLFITTNKKNSNSTKKIYIIVYTVLIVFMLVAFSTHILKFLDYMMNNFFITVYFPNLAIYFAAIIVSNVIAFISVFNFDINRMIRNINITVYTIISFIFILLVGVVSDKNLNIYSQKSIYTNNSALVLIQLTSAIFISWIIFLTIYYLIRRYQEKNNPKKKEVEKKRILPSNLIEIKIPDIAYKQSKKKVELSKAEVEKITREEASKYVQEKIKESKQLDKFLTKEDYLVLLKLLKEKKQEKSKEIVHDDQESYLKLQEMYKSVR